jgi:outer membrane protein TolC
MLRTLLAEAPDRLRKNAPKQQARRKKMYHPVTSAPGNRRPVPHELVFPQPVEALLAGFAPWFGGGFRNVFGSALVRTRRSVSLLCGMIPAFLAASGAHAQVSFYMVVDSALRNNPQVRMSTADVERAQAGEKESVGVFKPNFMVGSGLGYTYGFPVGQPAIYSVSAQSLAFSFSQPDYIRAARNALRSAQLRLKDVRQQTILDAALDYIELSKVTQEMNALDEERGYVQKLIEIEDARVDAGRDSKMELTRARLLEAQVGLRRLQLVDQSDLLRARLGHLTGLAPADLTPQTETIPVPAPVPSTGSLDGMILKNNSGVQAAYAAAKSKLYTARGDTQQINRPVFGFGLEYNRYAKFNNYNEYYLRFQHNNFNVGIQIQLPLFDATRKARAQGSSADAAHAAAEADLLRNQTSESVLQLQKSLSELAAQEQVAGLQNELAQDQLEAVTTELRTGSGNPSAPALTPRDQQQAHINERSRYVDMLEAQFQLTQAQLNLMRSLGTIEDWAKSAPAPKP